MSSRHNEKLPFSGFSPIQRAKTTAEEAEEQLVKAIARGYKASGDRITEAELASELQVSRVPAREAMQKLQLRGILVEGERPGLRVFDYSPLWVAQLFELRFAIEKIIFQHVMLPGRDKETLLAELEDITVGMAERSTSSDPLVLSSIDLDFHRVIARHSGNQLAAQIWEGLALHLMIVFCRDWSSAADRTGEVLLHQEMIDYIKHGSLDDIDTILVRHYRTPPAREERRTKEGGPQ